jgi:deoxyhypusine synthase
MKSHDKEDYLIKKVVPFNSKNANTIDDLLKNLRFCGFQGRNLGRALDLLEKMCANKKILTVLALSGAMVPAGMGNLVCDLIENGLIDVLVTTGATISHDFLDTAVNIGHYLGDSLVDDDELFKHRINRVYDIFIPEENYNIAEAKLLEIIKEISTEKTIQITPSEFLKKIGKKIESRSILSVAAKHNLPIFVPAFSDSEFALDLIKFSIKEGYDFQFDILEDVKIFGNIIKNAEECATFIIGGGVPRNWSQQIFPLLDQIEEIKNFGYKYSVRIHTATEHDGGLSGCTISESKSWGKYSLKSQYVSVWCDATIAFPILVTGLLQRLNII